MVTASTRALLVDSAGTTDRRQFRAPVPICMCSLCPTVTRTLTDSLPLSRRSQAGQITATLRSTNVRLSDLVTVNLTRPLTLLHTQLFVETCSVNKGAPCSHGSQQITTREKAASLSKLSV